VKKELYEILAMHTGQNIDKIRSDSERDHWLTAQEAKDYGIIDSVYEI
jgi:ATP-dependent Clp protease protease subunit